MKFKTLVTPSIKEMFVSEIEAMILSGSLKVGDRLPAERDLAERMKISKSIVNLGINELKSKGFVEVVPRKGTFVCDYTKNGTIDTLLSIIEYNNGFIDQKTFNSIFEYKLHTESFAASLAAKNRNESDIQEIKLSISNLKKSNTAESSAIAILAFFHAIHCSTGNALFPLLNNAFLEIGIQLAETAYSFSISEVELNYFYSKLESLLEAIIQQQSEKASKLMAEFLTEGANKLSSSYFKTN